MDVSLDRMRATSSVRSGGISKSTPQEISNWTEGPRYIFGRRNSIAANFIPGEGLAGRMR